MRKAIWGSLTLFKMGTLIQAPHPTPTSELSYSMPGEFTLNAQFLTAILVVVSLLVSQYYRSDPMVRSFPAY
jgi:hypothetical protein